MSGSGDSINRDSKKHYRVSLCDPDWPDNLSVEQASCKLTVILLSASRAGVRSMCQHT